MKRRGREGGDPNPTRQGRRKRRRGAAAQENAEEGPPSDGEQDDLDGDRQGDNEAGPSIAAQRRHLTARRHAHGHGRDHAAADNQEDPDAGDGDASEDDGEDDAAPDGNAADGLPDINSAATALCRLTGLPLEVALNALRESQEEVESLSEEQRANPGRLLEAWLEAAQMWLACNQEVQGEIDEVRVAMEESLQQYEAAKAADNVALTERPADFLRDRFLNAAGGSATVAAPQRSVVIKRVSEFACYRALFADGASNHKAPLVKLADLESKCRRWYPNKGTALFWEKLAEDCTAEVVQAAPALPDLQLTGWVSCAEGSAGCATCATATGSKLDADAASTSAAAGQPKGEPDPHAARRVALGPAAATAVVSALGVFAKRKLEEVEQEVCKMPTISGQVPDVFAALDDRPGVEGESDGDDIVVVSASEFARVAVGQDRVEV